ncbi:hypothetical protein O3P69_006332 [Scylla paramamosain]|uniref:Uncharacterized protein n=1 Tax=Scylla paramamosain TaxID=85552 RepID=A0AAW0U3D2_SCYPA
MLGGQSGGPHCSCRPAQVSSDSTRHQPSSQLCGVFVKVWHGESSTPVTTCLGKVHPGTPAALRLLYVHDRRDEKFLY